MYYDSLYKDVMVAQPTMSIQQAMVIIQLYIFELRKVKISLPIRVSSKGDIEFDPTHMLNILNK